MDLRALYALALAEREGASHVAEEGLGALNITTREALEATGADEADLGPLRMLLWRRGDKPAEPQPDAVMAAADTGDGWYLSWVDDATGKEIREIPWPFGESDMDATDMHELGFTVVQG